MNITATIAISAAIAGGVAVGGAQQWRVHRLQVRLIDAQQEVALVRSQRDGAVSAAEQCSEQVSQLQILASERARAADDARRDAEQAAADRNKRADDILSTPLGADPCLDATQLLQRWYQ